MVRSRPFKNVCSGIIDLKQLSTDGVHYTFGKIDAEECVSQELLATCNPSFHYNGSPALMHRLKGTGHKMVAFVYSQYDTFLDAHVDTCVDCVCPEES